MEKGNAEEINILSSTSIDTHFGIHLDAPLNFIKGRKSLENLEFKKLLIAVFVLEIYNTESRTNIDFENANIHEIYNKLIFRIR